MIAIVINTKSNIITKSKLGSHAPLTLNNSHWDKKITIDNPFKNPSITAVCRLVIGLTLATKANATDSGISARATVVPAKMSPLKYFLLL